MGPLSRASFFFLCISCWTCGGTPHTASQENKGCQDGCNDDPRDDSPQPAPIDISPQERSPLQFTPEDLVFFGDAQQPVVTRTLRIKNISAYPVRLDSADITKAVGTPFATDNDANYFKLPQPLRGAVLEPGATLLFNIVFEGASAQKQATLMIQTSTTAMPSIEIPLIGKTMGPIP